MPGNLIRSVVVAISCLVTLPAGAATAPEVELTLFIDIVIPVYAANREVDLDVFKTSSKHSVKMLEVSCDFEPLSRNFVTAIKRTYKEDKDTVPWTDRRARITVRGEDQNGNTFSAQTERVFYFGASEPIAHNIDSNGNPEHLCVFTIDTPF